MIDERINVIDALIVPVESEGVEVKVNRVGEVKIGGTGVKNDFD